MDLSRYTQGYRDELLKRIIDKLEELDGEDYFSTEGWKHFFGVED